MVQKSTEDNEPLKQVASKVGFHQNLEAYLESESIWSQWYMQEMARINKGKK